MKTSMIAISLITLAFLFIRANLNKTISVPEGQGIAFFEGTWSEALAEAKAQDKLIFLDAYASWCGPCKMMANQTFIDKEAGDFFNEKFINLKIDMEKGEGPAIARKYGVRSYPSLFFIDGDGKVVQQAIGYRDAKNLVALGQSVLKNQN